MEKRVISTELMEEDYKNESSLRPKFLTEKSERKYEDLYRSRKGKRGGA